MKDRIEPTDEPCRIPGCGGKIEKLFRWQRRPGEIRIGSKEPTGRMALYSTRCAMCGVEYGFLKARKPEGEA